MFLNERQNILKIIFSNNLYKRKLQKEYNDFYLYILNLNKDKPFNENIYLWINNLDKPPVCCCGNDVKFLNLTLGYSKHCSYNCSNSSDNIINKKKETLIKNYGILKQKIKEQTKKTNLERYGVENPAKSEIVKEKIKKTNLERYGVSCSLHNDDVSKQTKETNLERYGVENPAKSEIVKEKMKQTNLERYGVEWQISSKQTVSKIHTTNLERYGVENSKQILLKDMLDKLNNRDWLIEQNHILKKNLYQIKTEFNIGGETVLPRYFSLYNVEIKHYNNTIGCIELCSFLKEHNIIVNENVRNIISPYELDIFLPEYNIAIEYCGLYWHSTKIRPDKNYHLNKMKMCNEKGIKLITLYEDEWNYKKDLVKQKILYKLKLSKQSIGARKTCIRDVGINESKFFLEENHIQGYVGSTVRIGLYYENKLVSLLCVKKENNVWNITRYASTVNVSGGFSKLLNYFIEKNNPNEIITFADLRWDSGDLYIKNNFMVIDKIRPDYYYVVNDKRVHKFNFRKKRISKKYNIDIDNKTESQLISELNILKIYDCGKIKYKRII
jgi:hypothetical protein